MTTAFNPPTLAQFQAQFPRDWPYGSGSDKVTPQDVQNAINEAYGLFNPKLWNNTVPVFSASITGDTTDGSPTVSNLSSVSGLKPGQAVTGAGIPSGATIDLVGASSIVLTANATATATAVAMVVGGASGYSVSESIIAYCYLTAHLLVLSLQNAGGLGAPSSYQGANSSGGGIIAGKSVGSVSVTYTLPEFVTKSPSLSQYMRTGYGQKYLQMLAPKLPGRRVVVVGGEPTPYASPMNNLGAPIP